MKPFLLNLRGEATKRAPFWFMRQAGRYLPEYRELRASCSGFWELCFTPAKAAEVTLQPIRRFGMDAAILFSDILVIPHALGREVRFLEGEGPKLEPVTPEAIAGLSYDAKRLSPIMETVERAAKALDGATALIGFSGAPWTVAAYMAEGGGSRDYAGARAFALRHKEAFAALLAELVEATLDYLASQVKAGAEALQLFDSWAGVLSPEEYRAYVIAPTRALVEGLRARCPGVPVIGFARGNPAMLAEYAAGTGVDALGIDTATPLDWAARQLPHAVLQGNLDPLVLMSDKQASLDAARRMRELMRGKPYVFNLGHGVLQHTPVEHVAALSDVLRA